MKNVISITLAAATLVATMAGCGRLPFGPGDTGGTSPGGASPGLEGAVVVSTVPASDEARVPLNRKVTAKFDKDVSPGGIDSSSFKISGPDGSPIGASVAYDAASTTAILTPDANLPANSAVTAVVVGGAKDESGSPKDFQWVFKTGDSVDDQAPSLYSMDPAASSSGVSTNSKISVTLTEAMDSATISQSSFILKGPDGSKVAGQVSYFGTTASFKPDANLMPNSTYSAVLSTEASDLAGNHIVSDIMWNFTTGSGAARGPAKVLLGTAENYVILAETKISTTGTTAVTGNLGLSPYAQTFFTGFSETRVGSFATSPVVTGKLFAADMDSPTPSVLTTAIGDMKIAYTDAAGRPTPDHTELFAGDVSGRTLEPGLYKWGTGLLMSTDIKISGGSNDVWIFQIAQDLNVANGVHVILEGGAQAKNIFWQVAGQTKLGTTSSFKGIILCQTQIVLQTGASLAGRALAQTAVTLDANAVSNP